MRGYIRDGGGETVRVYTGGVSIWREGAARNFAAALACYMERVEFFEGFCGTRAYSWKWVFRWREVESGHGNY